MTRGLLDRARQELRESPAAPAGFLALAVILVWSARDGASDPLVWAPGTLFVAALLVVVALTAPGAVPGGRAGVIALGSFAAFTGWSFLSILWADVPADAWSGANKTLAYFCVYALLAARAWQPRAAAAFLGAYSAGIAAIGIWDLRAVSQQSDRLLIAFLEGRFAEPISYANANCALYLSAAFPALYLAARREVPVVARGLLLACAGSLVQLAVLCQSRMSLLALPVMVALYLLIVPGRLRSLLSMAFVGVTLAISAPRLLAVYEAVLDRDDPVGAVGDAWTAMLMSMVALLGAGVAWGLLDRRVVVPERVARGLGVAAAVTGAALVLTGSALFVERYGDPVDQATVWWDRFKGNDYVTEAGTPHLVSGFGGAGRYDIWRVALDLFEEHPATGIGVDNFAVEFLQRRTIEDNPYYPHSVELRLLQQTGLIGTALFVAFVVAALVAGWGALRTRSNAARGVAGSALIVFAYWLVHGSVDWLWEIPALSAAAFASLGLVVALAPGHDATRRRWPTVAAVCVGVATLVTVGAAWLSSREVRAALDSWRASPAVAYQHLDRARAWDPFSDQPDVLAGVIAAQQGDIDLQRQRLLRALERNPHNWYPYLELGLVDARQGRRGQALDWLGRAAALNPLDSTIEFALDRVREGRPPTQAEIDEEILRSAEQLTGFREG